MIKEIHEGIYKAIGKEHIPLLASDLEEPKERPAFKVYVKPESTRFNSNVRFTKYSIMILYYASNMDDYYIELYEMMEEIEDALLGSIELKNGVFIDFDELEFEPERDLLVIYTSTTIDTYKDSDEDNELMMELNMYMESTDITIEAGKENKSD